MVAFHMVGAAAPGPVAPERPRKDDARELGGGAGIEVQGTVGSPDSAAKLIATATARAALLGIEVRQLEGGAWLLQHASGAPIGVVHGREALRAAIDGFQAVCDDVADQVRSIGARAAAPVVQADDNDRAQVLTERLRRAGWTLTGTAAGDPAVFMASRWGRSRELPDLAAVEAFAQQVGATA